MASVRGSAVAVLMCLGAPLPAWTHDSHDGHNHGTSVSPGAVTNPEPDCFRSLTSDDKKNLELLRTELETLKRGISNPKSLETQAAKVLKKYSGKLSSAAKIAAVAQVQMWKLGSMTSLLQSDPQLAKLYDDWSKSMKAHQNAIDRHGPADEMLDGNVGFDRSGDNMGESSAALLRYLTHAKIDPNDRKNLATQILLARQALDNQQLNRLTNAAAEYNIAGAGTELVRDSAITGAATIVGMMTFGGSAPVAEASALKTAAQGAKLIDLALKLGRAGVAGASAGTAFGAGRATLANVSKAAFNSIGFKNNFFCEMARSYKDSKALDEAFSGALIGGGVSMGLAALPPALAAWGTTGLAALGVGSAATDAYGKVQKLQNTSDSREKNNIAGELIGDAGSAAMAGGLALKAQPKPVAAAKASSFEELETKSPFKLDAGGNLSPSGKTYNGRVFASKKGGDDFAGQMSYNIQDGKMNIEVFDIASDFQGQGASRVMLGKALQEHPEVKSIATQLSDDNAAIFEAAMKRGLSAIEAVMETPAYKIRRTFGFTNIVSVTPNASGAKFVVEKP